MRNRPRLNKYERRVVQKQKLEQDLSGAGRYIYQNNTDGDLRLPKPTNEGITTVGPRNRFEGDSYYMKWVGSPMNMLKLVQVIEDANEKKNKEKQMNEQKLILDQPDTVTTKGTVERVVVKSEQSPINDSVKTQDVPKDILLNEDPLDGVEIILG
jgi:hypothetical protein